MVKYNIKTKLLKVMVEISIIYSLIQKTYTQVKYRLSRLYFVHRNTHTHTHVATVKEIEAMISKRARGVGCP